MKKITRSAFGIASVVFIATTFLVVLGFAADAPTTVTNIFKPLSTPAQAIHDVSMLAIAICAGIFLVVGGLLLTPSLDFANGRATTAMRSPRISAAIKDLMKTYVKHPPRKAQSEAITISGYEKFQFIRGAAWEGGHHHCVAHRQLS